jgi:hypothetical protein
VITKALICSCGKAVLPRDQYLSDVSTKSLLGVVFPMRSLQLAKQPGHANWFCVLTDAWAFNFAATDPALRGPRKRQA